ncbi:citrate synthase family protein [Paraburkholderia denitrificans]|uniref:Citrate synthase family protein n=2 Tax=Paraburkholderia denitrificans TaxID=694025 RepID=A0ABW0J4V9_9BURK
MANETPVPLGSSDGLYMTAEEAASALNVSVPTLYTYVSRKNIRAHKTRGSRVSRYLRSDIEQIKSGIAPASARDTAPGLTGSSAITLMTEAGSFYRGVSAIDLAEEATLEDVARLLWDAGDFDPFDAPATSLPPHSDALPKACASYAALDRAIMLLPAVEGANPRAHDLGKQGFLRSGADVLRWFAAWMLGESVPAKSPLHRYIGATTKCGAKLEDAVRRVLVLSADQALHPATYVARAAASTGATPYRCVIAGLSAVTGRRLPAVRVAALSRFLAEIDTASDTTEPVRIRVRESEDIPGFGYSPFNAPDPRSAALWASLRVLLAADRNFARFERAIDLAVDLTGQQPDFALLAAYVNRRIGAAPDANLVRLGRIAGWVAHAWEQQNEAPLVRWKVNYNGVLPR